MVLVAIIATVVMFIITANEWVKIIDEKVRKKHPETSDELKTVGEEAEKHANAAIRPTGIWTLCISLTILVFCIVMTVVALNGAFDKYEVTESIELYCDDSTLQYVDGKFMFAQDGEVKSVPTTEITIEPAGDHERYITIDTVEFSNFWLVIGTKQSKRITVH